jgi:HD-like signal output (HDOD) protein
MQLGRTHRAQLKVPIHFSSPDRSKTYIGETINISTTGFSVQVTTSDPLPTIILAGILPTTAAGDAILCKARVVWQGGVVGGMKRASYKITSISQKSQDRLDRIIEASVADLIAEMRELALFRECPVEEIENLLHLARLREVAPETSLYAPGKPHTVGLFVVLEGTISEIDAADDAPRFSAGSVIGQWTSPVEPPVPPAVTTRAVTRLLHLPMSLTQEILQEIPSVASRLRDALGRPVAERIAAPRRAPRKLKPNLLDELQEIPTLPAVFNAVMDCIEDQEATPRDLAHIIRRDQSLTTRILRTINSALYGFSRRIGSVDEAVVLLGMTQTANLAVTALLLNTLVDSAHPGRRPEAFWEHSLGTAYIAQAIGESLKNISSPARRWAAVGSGEEAGEGPRAIEDAPRGPANGSLPRPGRPEIATGKTTPVSLERIFTCAIVHDIGLTTMYVKFPEHFAAVQAAIPEFGSLYRAEQEVLEVDHCQLGYRIALAWRLPEPLPSTIAEHHLPQLWAADIEDRERVLGLLREDKLVTLISLADLMTRHCGIGLEMDAQPPVIPEVFLQALGLSEEDTGEIIAEGATIKEKVELFFRGMAG